MSKMENLEDIRFFLIQELNKHIPHIKVTIDSLEKFEVSGTIEAMQGKKKVDGIYFASVVPKPKDVRFYFFPLYTHRVQLFDMLSSGLSKMLKGKTCFHIRSLENDHQKELQALIHKGVKLYQKDKLLSK